jgi:RNA polymerase sigma factor (sigma-70 family)
MMASANRGVVFQQIDRLYRDGTLSGLGDGQLLERYLSQGDEAAFEALVNLHGPMVLGLCRRVLRDPRDIEDAFQATFLVLVRKASTIRDRLHLSNWLYGVAYRVARRARTNTLRRRDREIAVENLEASAAPETADILGIGPVLDQELNRLPRKYRAPLILCYLKGHTHDQAAEELECPVGTVRSRLARGRDLLRRRLTSRGNAPTATILGTETALPARLLTEAVPPSLVSATVDAALGIGASKTIQAVAASASALALTQGVLTTMKLAQLKLMGLAILATSLSAGAVVAVAYGASQNPKDALDANGVLLKAADPQEKTVGAPVPMEDRLKAVEEKLDSILKRSGTASASTASEAADPFRPLPARTQQDDRPRRDIDSTFRSIRELEIELRMAIDTDRRYEKLFENHAISTEERQHARGQVLLVRARIEGLDDEFAEELARLEFEIEKKKAELDHARAQKEVATSVVVRNVRLNERKAGMVDDLSVTKAEGELKVGDAQVRVKKAELDEVDLRVRQLERRRHQIQQVIKLAGALQKQNLPANPAASPGIPAPRP